MYTVTLMSTHPLTANIARIMVLIRYALLGINDPIGKRNIRQSGAHVRGIESFHHCINQSNPSPYMTKNYLLPRSKYYLSRGLFSSGGLGCHGGCYGGVDFL